MDTDRMDARKAAWLRSSLLLLAVLATAGCLAVWKHGSLANAATAAAGQPEPVESVTAAVALSREYRPTTTAIGTVMALRSITLRNELPGTVRKVALTPGQIVAAGTVLVALDVSVEQAELDALEARAALATSVLERVRGLRANNAVSEEELDRARADRDVALAQIARTRAIIERKTIRAPFRARAGLSDVHPGQYLNEGTLLTTLQGVDDAVHVDFAVEQRVAAALRDGDTVDILAANGSDKSIEARIVAIDARVDPATRNAAVRARIEDATKTPSPGASVQIRVPVGAPRHAVAIPASALRKGPGGDHVFVLTGDPNGNTRAHRRPVEVTALLGDEAVISGGLAAGEEVAAAGSFKLRESVLVSLANAPQAGGGAR